MPSRTYVNPADPNRERPSLIAGLMKYPTTRQHPRENQVSEALCWLIDNSSVLAEATVRLFLTDAQATHVLGAAAGCIGATTRISLPAPPGAQGPYFPDIWVAGGDRSFQLMIEVKVTAAEHSMRFTEEGFAANAIAASPDVVHLIQKEAYRFAWSLLPPEVEARFVGLLSRDFVELAPGDARAGVEQARNVTWRGLREAFERVEGAVEPEVRLVFKDFLHAIGVHVQRPGPAYGQDDAERALRWGAEILAAARTDRGWLSVHDPSFSRVVGEPGDSFGYHVKFRRAGLPLVDVHIFTTHPDGKSALPRESEPAFYLLTHRSAYLEASDWQLGEAGGYIGWRLTLPFSQLGWKLGDREPPVDEALVARVTDWIRTSLERGGLV